MEKVSNDDIPSLEYIKEIVTAAGELFKERFNTSNQIEIHKKISDADLVTHYDIKVEELLKSSILKKYPTHQFLCEESSKPSEKLTDAPTWIIDPIDGTTNFVHKFPYCCISIGFTINKELLLGVIYAPILNELFCATKGAGATFNGIPMKTSDCKTISNALALVSFGVSTARSLQKDLSDEERASVMRFKEVTLKNIDSIICNARDLRHLGSTALELAYVALGRLDIVAALGPKEWDMAAGILLIREAGGYVIDYDGCTEIRLDQREIIGAASKELALETSKLLTRP